MTLPTGHLTYRNTAQIGLPVRVFVDGVEVKDCREAHTEEGWVVITVRDQSGRYVIDGDEFKAMRITGNVTVELLEAAA